MNGSRGCSASRRVVYAARAMPRRISNLRFSDAACCFSAPRRASISFRSVGTSLQAHSGCQNANYTSVARAQLCSGALSTRYHRLIGLALNLVCWTRTGKRCKRPYRVPFHRWQFYDVHHLNWNPHDCRRSNLAPISKKLHAKLKKGTKTPWESAMPSNIVNDVDVI